MAYFYRPKGARLLSGLHDALARMFSILLDLSGWVCAVRLELDFFCVAHHRRNSLDDVIRAPRSVRQLGMEFDDFGAGEGAELLSSEAGPDELLDQRLMSRTVGALR